MSSPTATRVPPAPPEVVTRELTAPRQPWIERARSADHKIVGQLYIATALTFIALAAVEFALMRLQLIVPENTMIEPEIFSRLLTASVSSFLTLGLIPLALGLIGYVLPLQIGARGTALPRLGQLSYWLYAFGAATILGSFMYTVPETGTIGLPPLSDLAFSPSHGADAWIVGTALAVLGFVLFSINLLTTVRNLRAPGLAWRRLPLFSWAGTVISAIMLLVGPAMIAALMMLMVDRQFDGVFFDPGEGGAPLLYEHLGYIFLTGSYLIVLLFASGAISEILPTFSRKPIFSHRAVAGSFIAIAALGLLAWMQNMYAAPLNEGWTIAAMLFALALVVPVGLLFYSWIATLWDGTLRLRAASWYALAAVSTMACGLAGELGYSVIPVGWALDNTTASQGDTLYLLVGGGVFGGFAALHYWFPKLSGHLLGEGLGKASLVMMLVGIHLYVIPMFLAGLEGQPVDIFKYYEDTGVDGYNLIASIGAFILALGILLELGNAAYSWNNGIGARGHDPWGAPTLEWFALSPPPPHNFDAVPDVRSPEPLYDIRDAVARRAVDFTVPEPLARIEPEPALPARSTPDAPGGGPDHAPGDANAGSGSVEPEVSGFAETPEGGTQGAPPEAPPGGAEGTPEEPAEGRPASADDEDSGDGTPGA